MLASFACMPAITPPSMGHPSILLPSWPHTDVSPMPCESAWWPQVSIETKPSWVASGLAAGRRYRTDIQRARSLRERQRQLILHLREVSTQISAMAADDPWKLVQRVFEYGFFFNGLAQVCPPRIRAPVLHEQNGLFPTACRIGCPIEVSPSLSQSEAGGIAL